MIDFSKKYNYKIRIKATGKFISGDKSKSTWMRPSVVYNKIVSITTPNPRGYRSYEKKYKREELEVIMIPLAEQDAVNVDDFMNAYGNIKESNVNRQERERLEAEQRRKLDRIKELEAELEQLKNEKA